MSAGSQSGFRPPSGGLFCCLCDPLPPLDHSTSQVSSCDPRSSSQSLNRLGGQPWYGALDCFPYRLCPLFGTYDKIKSLRQNLLLSPEGLPDQPLPTVSRDGVSRSFGDGHAQSSRSRVVLGADKKDQRTVGGATASAQDLCEIAALYDALTFAERVQPADSSRMGATLRI